MVRDGDSHRVLARVAGDNMRASLVEQTLRQAVTLHGQLPGNLILHTDRGANTRQSKSLDWQPACRSCGRRGAPGQHTSRIILANIQKRVLHRHVSTAPDELRQGTHTWIDTWYNAKAGIPHSATSAR